jgi:peptidoglycan/LPS O-acetylase OafA/YrhL
MFPALMLLGWLLSQRGRRIGWGPVLVGTATAISFWLAMAGPWALGPVLARWATYLVGFYGPFARAWEFAVGALLSLVTTSRVLRSARHARGVAWLGVALLAASACLIDRTTPFPGPWTLLPVTGTLLLIAAGTHHFTWVNRMLASPPMVKIGDWSYSIYLWHWPLMVFAVILWPEASSARILAGLVSFVPAVASYRWVEQPIRRLPPLTTRRTVALVAAVVSPAMLLAATADVAADQYWIPRYHSGAFIAHQGDTTWDDFLSLLPGSYYPCTDRAMIPDSHGRCWQSKPAPRIDIALVGDSHAEHLFLGLAEALPEKNIAYYIAGEFPVRSARMDTIIDHVASDPAIESVIVTAAWAAHHVPQSELVQTLKALGSKDKAVFVTDDVPPFSFDAVACKYRTAPILPFARCSEDRKRFEAAYARFYPELKAAVDAVPGVQLLKTARYFCDDKVCSMNNGEALLYRDSWHLNNVGSRFIANRMLTDFPQFRAALTSR